MVPSLALQDERTYAAEISSVVAERQRRKSARRPRERALAWGKATLVGIIGVALISIFCNGNSGHQESKYPFLGSFLQTSNRAAADAIGPDVQSVCADPKRWLNSAGHDLLSGLPGFNQHNASMLWGTYRPGVYFGFKTRTSPVSVTGGLMWHAGDGHNGVKALRHECNEGNGVGPYGWTEHDGKSFGRQDIVDDKAGLRLVTSVVKPGQLEDDGSTAPGPDKEAADVLLASRIDVSPGGAAAQMSAATSGPATIYFYIGLDCSASAGSENEHPCLEALEAGEESRAGLVVVGPDSKARRSLLVRGSHPQHGGFKVEANVVSTRASDASASSVGEEETDCTVAFLGRKGVLMVDVEGEVEKLHEAHRRAQRAHRRGGKIERGAGSGAERVPFTLPNQSDVGSNVIVVQVTGLPPFTVDFVVRSSAAGQANNENGNKPSISASSGDGTTAHRFVPSETVSGWLAAGSRSFSEQFHETFSLDSKGFDERDVAAAKAALSNMLGGMGYFTGRSEVRGAGSSGGNQLSFEASLFTAVPSRSFFPRGFLWDEGFHQLLISAWDKSTSVDVLGHWLSVMHVHDTAGEVTEKGCSGGWLPREQILGKEARRRVPAPFLAQDISVANPPTLLLLVESLLRGLSGPESEDSTAQRDVCGVDSSVSHPGCPTAPAEVGQKEEQGQERDLVVFLRKAYPLLDSWIRWLLITQRPGATGWGGRAEGAPLGAFQWRGRDPGDDRLNALTLASGLDDYPRASHPSQHDESHVDVVSWLALGCRVMQRLSSVIGVEGGVPYGKLYDELVEGVFDFHWEEEEEAFFDRGLHVADGELVDEVIMRCMNADRSTEDIGVPLADVTARKAVCSPNQQHMYPLGDGRGGLLTRRRWKGGIPRPQHVHHIGYVSIFPLLLKLLPPESHAVGSILAHMRDPAQLWSPHGLRSLSSSDPFYQVENNPGDEPYWRGHIWINVNYLALGALRHYSQADGPFRRDALKIYSELRSNLSRTLLGGYHSTGYFWEQYDDRSGLGLRSHPFTGWTALVVLIMAEIY